MNILHVIGDLSPRSGGTVAAVTAIARGQSGMGHTVQIATTDVSWKEKYRMDGVAVTVFHCQFAPWRWSWGMTKQMAGLIGRSDVVHAHGLWEFPMWWAGVLAGVLGKPFVITPHGMLDRSSLQKSYWKKKIYLWILGGSLLKRAGAVHFTAEGERDASTVISPAQSVCIPLGLPETFYAYRPDADAFKRRFPRCQNHRLILYLGRVHPKKRPDLLIESFAAVGDQLRDALLVIAGPGEKSYLLQLKKSAENLGIRHRILFTGMLRGEAVNEAYRAAEIFVLPSVQENFGFSIAEALGMGCPVIVSRSVNLARQIEVSGAGLVCDLDRESLSAALRQALSDPVSLKRMGENGRKWVIENFNSEQTVRALLAVYDRLMKRG